MFSLFPTMAISWLVLFICMVAHGFPTETIDGCALAAAEGNNTNLNISLGGASNSALQLNFGPCYMDGMNITLLYPHPLGISERRKGGVRVWLHGTKMRSGSFVIVPGPYTPSLPPPSGSPSPTDGDLALVQDVAVYVENTVLEDMVGDVLLVHTSSESPQFVAVRNVRLSVKNSTLHSLKGSVLSIATGGGSIADVSIAVLGPTRVVAGGRLAASVEASVINETTLSARAGRDGDSTTQDAAGTKTADHPRR
jgi:hypothetical protein